MTNKMFALTRLIATAMIALGLVLMHAHPASADAPIGVVFTASLTVLVGAVALVVIQFLPKKR